MAEHVDGVKRPARMGGGPRFLPDADGGTLAQDTAQAADPRYLGPPPDNQDDADALPQAGNVSAGVPAQGRSGFSDYFPDLPFGAIDETLPQPGERLWYRMSFDGSDSQIVEAVVLDPMKERCDPPHGHRTLHLAINLSSYFQRTSPEGDPHGTPLASAPVGFRYNVVEGEGAGQWMLEKPEGSDATYEAYKKRHLMVVEERRLMAREGGLVATHRGRLPRNVK